MKTLKVSSSGQITLPRNFRNKYNTDIFTYEIHNNECTFIPIFMTIIQPKEKKKQYELKDLKKAIFHSKHQKNHHLSKEIDQTLYNP